ncbi:MAG: hypothetical protein EKK40_12915 [Bradyrhizobiaceae bacterium]|nr:MAG: hypothetical protein EKK40_12915 [Bradyrhizobiaceae bacterium]
MNMLKTPIESSWKTQADDARTKADHLREGQSKERLLKTARQLDTAAKMHRWMESPGLKPPQGK